MAKSFVKITLASKLRLLFGAALIGIIAAALVLPWYFMDLLAEQGVQQPAGELARMRLAEWLQFHSDPKLREQGRDSQSAVIRLFAAEGQDGRKGPLFIPLDGQYNSDHPLDSSQTSALKDFRRNADRDVIIRADDDQGRTVWRYFRAVRAEQTCLRCHGPAEPINLHRESDQLMGIVDVTLPGSAASGPLMWWTRLSFVIGGGLAALVAFILFTIITQKLILRPLRELRDLADKVTEGDLSARSSVRTGDELQRLGDSFNEMLSAIADQHDRLRSANRALDLKLSELGEANITLFRANQVKNEFLANVSHELRTPLNSIIGFADLVTAAGDDERMARYGQNITSSAKSLLNMINDILDLAKIEAGKADVRFDKVSVTDTCQTLASLMKPLADTKQLGLQVELDPAVPIVVTDGGKLQQILYNLLSNAIKFTPSGGQVFLRTKVAGQQLDGQDAREVLISVQDTGPGISEADQQHIFEKFYQADRSLTKESPGTGLGLAISKELTSLIGGRLTLRSEPGHGATFTLTLPVEPHNMPSDNKIPLPV